MGVLCVTLFRGLLSTTIGEDFNQRFNNVTLPVGLQRIMGALHGVRHAQIGARTLEHSEFQKF